MKAIARRKDGAMTSLGIHWLRRAAGDRCGAAMHGLLPPLGEGGDGGRRGRLRFARWPPPQPSPRRGGRRPYCAFTFAAATSLSIVAAGVALSSFQNCDTTSLIAPSVADGSAMPCAAEGSRVPALDEETKSAAEVLAHSSNLSSFMPSLTGI